MNLWSSAVTCNYTFCMNFMICFSYDALTCFIVGLTVWQIENFLPVSVDECKETAIQIWFKVYYDFSKFYVKYIAYRMYRVTIIGQQISRKTSMKRFSLWGQRTLPCTMITCRLWFLYYSYYNIIMIDSSENGISC